MASMRTTLEISTARCRRARSRSVSGSGNSCERFHVGTRDAVLLADTDRVQTAVADVAAHGFDVQLQPLRNIKDREQIFRLIHGGQPRYWGDYYTP